MDTTLHVIVKVEVEKQIKTIFLCQVNLDEDVVKKMADEHGNMSRENFLQLGTKTKLVDLAGREQETPEHTPTKHPHHSQKRVGLKCFNGILTRENKTLKLLQAIIY